MHLMINSYIISHGVSFRLKSHHFYSSISADAAIGQAQVDSNCESDYLIVSIDLLKALLYML